MTARRPTRRVAPTTDRPTLYTLVFNIDMSGSMAWAFDGSEKPAVDSANSRLGVTVQAIKQLLGVFVEEGFEAVTCVRFQPFTNVALEADAGTFRDLTDLVAIESYLDSIVAGGITRYEPAMEATAVWLGDARNRSATNIVYLLSDGADAVGFDPMAARIDELHTGYNAPDRASLRVYAYGIGTGTDDLDPEQLGTLVDAVVGADPLVPDRGGVARRAGHSRHGARKSVRHPGRDRTDKG